MAKSTTLKTKQGERLYPKTTASLTFMSNNVSVESEINELKEKTKYYKGHFATEEALVSRYHNGVSEQESQERAGWYAVVDSTDTIWVWDTHDDLWLNSSSVISAVTSVNGEVGDVVLTGADIDATVTKEDTSDTKPITGHLNDIYDELSNKVTLDTDQIITGTKVFDEVIGLRNVSEGTVDQIKHINSNFLITSGTGENLLNIDEGLETISAFNRQLAFEDEIQEIQGDYVSYSQQTGKTEAEKAQARANIGAGTSDIDTVKVNGVAQPIENGSVNITLPETIQSIPILENASVWELDEGWYIFKDYVTISQLYIIRNNSNREIPASILGYVSASYINTSNNNRLTKNLVLFCVEAPSNTSTIPVNVKSNSIVTMIEVSESSRFDLWETVKYDDFVTLGTGQTITGAKNFTGTLNKGGKAVATEEYVQENGGKIDSISVNGKQVGIVNKNVDLDVVESETYLENTGIGTPLDSYYTKSEVNNSFANVYLNNVTIPAIRVGSTTTGAGDWVYEQYISSDGLTWYAKWKSGRKEFFTSVVPTASPQTITINLPFSFTNENSYVVIRTNTSASTDSGAWRAFSVSSKTANSFTFVSASTADKRTMFYCCGY